MPEFEKVELQDSHKFRGHDFPVAFKLKEKANFEEVSKYLKKLSSQGFFKELLSHHGAIVLKGLGSTDPIILSKYIETIGIYSGLHSFVQNGTTAKRTEITEFLTTANEGPSTTRIHQHNEFSRFIKYPKWLFFTCEKFTAQNGETPIVHGGELFDDLFRKHPKSVKELADRGLYFEQVWPRVTNDKTSWADEFCFGRNLNPKDPIEVQKTHVAALVKETVSPDFEWDNENNLIVHQHTDPIRIYNTGDDSYPVFFNSIPTYYSYIKNKLPGHEKTANLKYNDGVKIPIDFLDEILESSIKLQYNHKWEEGDVAIVDNYQVSHGRIPWKNGDRRILVSMWDSIHSSDYVTWKP